jgi:hypothetical protein
MVKKSEKKVKATQPKARIDSLPNETRNRFIIGGIILLTVALFAKSVYYTFIGFDDPQYVIYNDLIRDLSLKGLKEIFTTPVIGMYNPLTFVVYAIEYQFFGLDPRGYHFFNLLFHLIATVLAYRFIFRLTGRYETAAIVALLFAIHPMHVSVVTWISQTKTSLCVIFYFSALISYLRYAKEGYNVKYLVYTGLFSFLAALSKPTAVTIAPMLLLLDYYLSRKLERKVFLEKIPLFAISVFFGVLTLLTHAEDSIFKVNQGYSLINNICIANYAVVFYLEKLFFPVKLSTIYPYPDVAAILPLKYYLALPVIPAILFLVFKANTFRRELVFGLMFFAITISVLVRIVPSGFFSAANRYTYLSYTGLFFIIGQFVTYVLDRRLRYSYRIRSYIVPLFFGLVIFYSYRTMVRVGKWKDSVTLFTDVLEKYPKVPTAYANRGYAKAMLGDYREAWVDYNSAIYLDSTNAQVYLNRALAESAMGMLPEALEDFDRVIELSPDYGAAYFDRALLKMEVKDSIGALEDFQKAESLGIEQATEKIRLLHAVMEVE